MDRRMFVQGMATMPVTAGAPLATLSQARAQRSPLLWRVAGDAAAKVRGYLATMPATVLGTGPKLYVLSSSLCPSCKAMNTRHPGAIAGLETRYIAYALNERESGAVARVWRNPTNANYRAYMAGRFRDAPPLPYTRSLTQPQIDRLANPRTDLEWYTKYNLQLSAMFDYFVKANRDKNPHDASGRYSVPTPSFFLPAGEEVWWARTGLNGIAGVQKAARENPGFR